jgi:hypothetical protein
MTSGYPNWPKRRGDVMAAPSLTYRQLQALSPCEDAIARVATLMGGADEWGETPITAKQARERGATFEDILWVAAKLSSTDTDVDRRLRLWMSDCAARVLAARRAHKRGAINAAVWAAAAAAWAAAWAAAAAAAAAAAGATAWAAAAVAAGAAAGAAAGSSAWAAAGAAAGAAEEAWQFDRLIARLSEPEPGGVALSEVVKEDGVF